MSLPRYDLLLIVLIGLWPSTFVIQSQMAKINESVCTPAAQQHVNSLTVSLLQTAVPQ